MDLTYSVDEGQQSFVEQIKIKGNTRTKDRVLRRELAISPGERFDMTRVDISRLRLEGMSYFSKVETKVEPTDVPNRKNLVIGVEEGSTGNFQIGAGFSSVDSIVGFAELTQGNFDIFNPPFFTGGGQKARLRVQFGTRRKDLVMTFIEPWFLDRKLRFNNEFYYRELDFLSDDFEEQRVGHRVSLTRELPFRLKREHRMELGTSYTIENVSIENIDPEASAEIRQEEGSRLVSKLGTMISYDSRGPGLLPDRGQRTALFGEFAGGPLGADTDFYKVELRSAWYFKGFNDGHIVELTGQLGVVDTHSGADRVPLFDRWFLGGLRNLRGYDFPRRGAEGRERRTDRRQHLLVRIPGIQRAHRGAPPLGRLLRHRHGLQRRLQLFHRRPHRSRRFPRGTRLQRQLGHRRSAQHSQPRPPPSRLRLSNHRRFGKRRRRGASSSASDSRRANSKPLIFR